MSNRFLVRDFPNSLSFDGNGDFVQIPANGLTPWDGESTLAFWTMLKGTPPSNAPIIDSQWGDNGGGGWQILVKDDNSIDAYVGDTTDRDNVNVAKFWVPNEWMFVVITKKTQQKVYRGNRGSISLMGTNATLSYGTSSPDTDIALRFGGNRTGGTELACYLALVEIYNTEINLAQATDLFYRGATKGITPIHKWDCSDGSGSTLSDVIGNVDGAITNATWSTNTPMSIRTVA